MFASLSPLARWLSLALFLLTTGLLCANVWVLLEYYDDERRMSATYCNNMHHNETCPTERLIVAIYILYTLALFWNMALTMAASLNMHNYDNFPTIIGAFLVFVAAFVSWIACLIIMGIGAWNVPETRLQWPPYIIFLIVSFTLASGCILLLCKVYFSLCKKQAMCGYLCGGADGVRVGPAVAEMAVSSITRPTWEEEMV
jgi:hypothetical protein